MHIDTPPPCPCISATHGNLVSSISSHMLTLLCSLTDFHRNSTRIKASPEIPQHMVNNPHSSQALMPAMLICHGTILCPHSPAHPPAHLPISPQPTPGCPQQKPAGTGSQLTEQGSREPQQPSLQPCPSHGSYQNTGWNSKGFHDAPFDPPGFTSHCPPTMFICIK